MGVVSEWGKGEDAAVDLGTGKDPTWQSHFLSVVTLRNSAGVERPVSEAILGISWGKLPAFLGRGCPVHLTPIAEGTWRDEATRSSLTTGGSSVGPERTLKSLPLPRFSSSFNRE